MSRDQRNYRESFSQRHIGPSESQIQSMLNTLNLKSLDELIEKAAPHQILNRSDLDLPEGLSEPAFLARARELATKNRNFKTYIGMGYYNTFTPPVIQRNILENPGWYTAYTPYQAEISQGRMEALLNFQTMVAELTGMGIANASLLDEGTAAAEAMVMAYNLQGKEKNQNIFVDSGCLPQTLEVLNTRALPLGIKINVGDAANFKFDQPTFAVIVQYPTVTGEVIDYSELSARAKKNNSQLLVAADILSLCYLKPPGEWGADIVFGSTQRFGVPMGFGGPHAAYLATRDEHKRLMPGRLIGLSKDVKNRPALRLALQTREQHIRREKATSNICTAQVLLAVMASMYAVYHGPMGLKRIAERVHRMASVLAEGLKALGWDVQNTALFDTVAIALTETDADQLMERALHQNINLGRQGRKLLSISLDETTTLEDIETLLKVFNREDKPIIDVRERFDKVTSTIPNSLLRTSDFLTHPVFNSHHSETQMLRYIHQLEQKDLALNSAMIPLGSCTMKLNATSEMMPVTWPKFNQLHPFVPAEQAQGTLEMIHQLEKWLSEITGFYAVSLQPNAGSQGEYAGLLVIRKYHESQGESHRNVCLIPSSAHGTNPASAVMAGMKVIVVKCDDNGNVDINDLREKAKAHEANLAALMITYPSTHGVFEEGIVEICDIVHSHGGQVYMDGANMNALVGIAKPGQFGPDVCHLNLHKTFCIPHGGGGPGVGPIGVAAHLKNFLPKHSMVPQCGPETGISAVAAAPWGSASILPISWAYIAMMGRKGLKEATQVAILNANYIAKKLEPYYPVLYKGKNGFVAHECILDVRGFKDSSGITVDDIAKRLIDFGFHAPTMSWPVPGTLMVEPTESEDLGELDRFCNAMISIRQEIREIEEGKADRENNVLRNAPHCLEDLMADIWNHPYSREKACFPAPWVKNHKFWPHVSRVDNVYGDRNLVCACPPVSDYSS